jgi:hypothetical protein
MPNLPTESLFQRITASKRPHGTDLQYLPGASINLLSLPEVDNE